MLHAGQRGTHLGDHGGAVEVAAAVGDAVAGDQHLGLDLPEPVQHGIGAHVGRADAPDTADAHHRQESDHRLGNVRQVGRDPVARLQALRLQVQCQRGHLTPQFGPAQLAVATLFVAADDGGKARRMGRHHMAKHLLRVIELGTLEPLRAGHPVFGQHGRVGRGRLQIEIVPDALPEGGQVAHRPAPQGVVAVERQAAGALQPILVQTDLGNVGRVHAG